MRSSALFWYITQRLLVLIYWRLDANFKGNGASWSLKMVPIGCPHTLVYNYKSKLRNIPEERKSPICIWILYVTYYMWHMWRIICDILWHIICDILYMTYYVTLYVTYYVTLYVTYYMWHYMWHIILAYYMWHIICDIICDIIWHIICDILYWHYMWHIICDIICDILYVTYYMWRIICDVLYVTYYCHKNQKWIPPHRQTSLRRNSLALLLLARREEKLALIGRLARTLACAFIKNSYVARLFNLSESSDKSFGNERCGFFIYIFDAVFTNLSCFYFCISYLSLLHSQTILYMSLKLVS
jgi:hypothetical protein